jgi:hypothetical protein
VEGGLSVKDIEQQIPLKFQRRVLEAAAVEYRQKDQYVNLFN